MRAVACVSVLLLWAASAVAQEESEAEPPPAASPEPPPAAAVTAPPSELESMKAELGAMRERLDQLETEALPEAVEVAPSGAEPLRIYGFMDFGLDKFFFQDPQDDAVAGLRPTTATTFVFGNLNVYLDARPLQRLHALVETRFSLAPHGEEISLGPPLGTSYERIDSVAFDFSSPSMQSQLRLGSIYIERAYGEYSFGPLLTVQWGLFLTPFGIWNLDHGSPTLISLMLPTFIASQMVPTRLLGVHLYGSVLFGAFELGYALHVSNGRSPLDYDLSEDKAVGARVFLTRDAPGLRFTLGSSAYLGTYLDQEKRIAVRPDGNLTDTIDTVAYDEQVLGFDGALDIGNLRVRSEAVLRWVHYEDGLHESAFSPEGELLYLPNRLEIDAYGLVAYRTPWIIEPYVQLEYTDKSYVLPRYAGKSRSSQAGYSLVALSIGANFELTPYTLLKLQVARMAVTDELKDELAYDVPFIYARVVTSF